MAFVPKETSIPNFVSAETPQGLRLAMYKLNQKYKMMLIFQDIQYAQNKWFAWYYIEYDRLNTKDQVETLGDIINESANNQG
jgi:hypothetical protein